MPTYQSFPFTRLTGNDTGVDIAVISTTLPTTTVAGYADFTSGTLYLAKPDGLDANSGTFQYTIQDKHKKTSTATVTVYFPASGSVEIAITAPTPAGAPYGAFGAINGRGSTISRAAGFTLSPGDLFTMMVAEDRSTGQTVGDIEAGWTLINEGGSARHHVRAWYRILDAAYLAQHETWAANHKGLFGIPLLNYPYLPNASGQVGQVTTEIFNQLPASFNYTGPIFDTIDCPIATAPDGSSSYTVYRTASQVSRNTSLQDFGYTGEFNFGTGKFDGAEDVVIGGFIAYPGALSFTSIGYLIDKGNDILQPHGIRLMLVGGDNQPIPRDLNGSNQGYLAVITAGATPDLPSKIFSGGTAGSVTLPNTVAFTFPPKVLADYKYVISNIYGFGQGNQEMGATVSDKNSNDVFKSISLGTEDQDLVFSRETVDPAGNSLDALTVYGADVIAGIRIVMHCDVHRG